MSGTANHFDSVDWMNHGNARSVRECGCHEGFKPGLLPHLLSRLLMIKPPTAQNKTELGQNQQSLGLPIYRKLEKTNTVLERFSRYNHNQDAEGD